MKSVHVSATKDISIKLYEDWTQLCPSEPALDELKKFLSSDPLIPLPLHPIRFHVIVGALKQHDDAKFERFFWNSLEENIDLDHLLEELARMPPL